MVLRCLICLGTFRSIFMLVLICVVSVSLSSYLQVFIVWLFHSTLQEFRVMIWSEVILLPVISLLILNTIKKTWVAVSMGVWAAGSWGGWFVLVLWISINPDMLLLLHRRELFCLWPIPSRPPCLFSQALSTMRAVRGQSCSQKLSVVCRSPDREWHSGEPQASINIQAQRSL